jgi:hypothetical protein
MVNTFKKHYEKINPDFAAVFLYYYYYYYLLTYLLRGLSPQANYTDQATAACRRR